MYTIGIFQKLDAHPLKKRHGNPKILFTFFNGNSFPPKKKKGKGRLFLF